MSEKGAKRASEIPAARLKLLNSGKAASLNLVEILAIDMAALAKAAGITSETTNEKSIVKRMKFYGEQIPDWKRYKAHASDTVRGFAVYSLAGNKKLSLADKLSALRHFADDGHFGVREWAWLAVREELAGNLPEAIRLLAGWSKDKSPLVRRFACEALRPRGVWCSHIAELKDKPLLALEILENLKADETRYVQDSVGNWLNDAAKSNPKVVKSLCATWAKSKNKHTDYIVKRALRSL